MIDPAIEWVDEGRGAFGRALRRARLSRQVSQSKLALSAGFDHSYVSRLETGTREPTRACVQQLADALELPAADAGILMAAAGFLPADGRLDILAAEPAALAAVHLLGDDRVPDGLRASFRDHLHSLTAVYRLAAGLEVGPS